MMKQIILLSAFITLLLSCSTDPPAQLAELQKENQLLKVESMIKDSTIKKFVRSFNQIMCNLDSIAATQKAISVKMKGKKKMQSVEKEKVMQDIEMINSLMEQNKNIASTMKVDFSSAKLNFTEFDMMLKNVQGQIDEKNSEINSLKKNLGDADVAYNTFDYTLDQLTTINVEMEKKAKEQQAIIDKQVQQLNTAYYILGTYKELKDAGVVAKSGLMRVENTLNNFNTSKFVKIDLRETKNINVWTSTFRILTNHPPNSYKAARNSLVITNPDEFWKLSKYLVVIKD